MSGVIGKDGQVHPVGEPAPTTPLEAFQDGPLKTALGNLAIGDRGGKIIIEFAEAIKWVELDPDAAEDICRRIRKRVKRIRRTRR